MLTQKRVLDIFESSGALLTGHFELKSRRHTRQYLQPATVFQFPEYLSAICAEIATRVKVDAVDVVIGPAIGGVILAHGVAATLGTRALFAEPSNNQLILRSGFNIEARDRIVVVDDMLATGKTVFQLIDLCESYDAQVVATAFVIDCSTTSIDLGVPMVSLAKIDIQTYAPDECPLCKADVPLSEERVWG